MNQTLTCFADAPTYAAGPATSEPPPLDSPLERAMVDAEAALHRWRRTCVMDRSSVVARVSALLYARLEDFAQLIARETGKSLDEARGEVRYSADILAYDAEHAGHGVAPDQRQPVRVEARSETVPIGIITGLESVSLPYYQRVRVTGPQLMAGNVLIVEHADGVPSSAIAFEQLWLEAGAPRGTYANLSISRRQAARVVVDLRVMGIEPGGPAAAARPAEPVAHAPRASSAAASHADTTFVVLEDADLDKAVQWAVWGCAPTHTATCEGAKRFVVMTSIANPFLARLRTALAAQRVARTLFEHETANAPSPPAPRALLDQIDAAIELGATILIGGQPRKEEGHPTTRNNATAPELTSSLEPSSDSVALLFRVADESEAIAFADVCDAAFGPRCWVFTRDIARGRRVARQIKNATIFIDAGERPGLLTSASASD